MKLPQSGLATISQVIHSPVNGTVAFFVILAACGIAGVALRRAPSGKIEESSYSLKTTRQPTERPRSLPLAPPALALTTVDPIGTSTPLGEYYVGVFVESVDPALMAQLKLEGGLVVRHVVPHSPAEAAGVKPNDVMMRAGDAPLKAACDLGMAVNTAGASELPFEFVREGLPLSLFMTPAKRPAQMWVPPGAATVSTSGEIENQVAGSWLSPGTQGVQALAPERSSSDSVLAAKNRIAELEKELSAARAELAKLKEELAKTNARQTGRR